MCVIKKINNIVYFQKPLYKTGKNHAKTLCAYAKYSVLLCKKYANNIITLYYKQYFFIAKISFFKLEMYQLK